MKLDNVAYRRMITKHYILLIAPCIISIYVGLKIDHIEANRMSKYRDKSALYGRELGPDEPPSWP